MAIGKSIVAGMLAGFMLTGAAFAQAAAPAPAPAAGAPAAPAKAAAPTMDKAAISKACSADATKQGLRGKERKAFRSKCKHEKMGKM